MKINKILLLTGILLVSLLAEGMAQNDDPAFTRIKKLIDSKEYVFKADRMLPLSGDSKVLTTDQYTLKIKNENAKAYLPYYGRAYQVSYGGDGGIDFDDKMEEYKTYVKEKKQRIHIDFKVKGENDTYRCNLSIEKSGSATLSIISNNRQSISYWGDIKELRKK